MNEVSWYVAHTRPRREKKLKEYCGREGLSAVLPCYRKARKYQRKTVVFHKPLFPGYVFVQMTDRNRLDILRLPGVVQIVSFQGKPAPVPLAEIEALRRGMIGSVVVHPHPYLQVGRRVRIVNGPMAGIEGIFVRRKDQVRIVISISLIQRSVAMEIGEAYVEPVS